MRHFSYSFSRLLSALLFAILCNNLLPTTSYAQQVEDRWWGYCADTDALSGFNTGQREDFTCAIYVEGNRGTAMGKSFNTVRLALQGTQSVSNLKVWVSHQLPESAAKADILTCNVDATQMTDGEFFEVTLPRTIDVDSYGMYVGYAFETLEGATGTGKKAVLCTTGVPSQPGGFFLKSSKTYKQWVDMSSYNRGNLALQLLLHGEFVDNAVSVEQFDEVITTPGKKAICGLLLRNRGVNGVQSIDFTLTVDGQKLETEHFSLGNRPITTVGDYFGINMEFVAPQQVGIRHIDVTIDRVNDEPNEATQMMSGRGGVVAITEGVPHNVLMEEVTGTWCMWCPRGSVAIENLTEQLGDRFVGIAIHSGNDDPMQITGYEYVQAQVTGLPGCLLDRQLLCDPYEGSSGKPFGIVDNVNQLLSDDLCPASVSVDAQWADDGTIQVTSHVSLQYDRDDNPPYALAYILQADGLTGSGSAWLQKNGFAGNSFTDYTSDPYLAFLTELPSYIQDYEYNDVAIAAYSAYRGIEGSVVGPFAQGVANDHTFTIDVSRNRLIQDRTKLKVVALLLNSYTGVPVNVARAKVTGDTRLESLADDTQAADIVARYSADGQPCSGTQRGLQIVRYKDGRVAKRLYR